MDTHRHTIGLRIATLIAAVSLVLAACGGSAASGPASSPESQVGPDMPVASPAPSNAGAVDVAPGNATKLAAPTPVASPSDAATSAVSSPASSPGGSGATQRPTNPAATPRPTGTKEMPMPTPDLSAIQGLLDDISASLAADDAAANNEGSAP